MNFNNISGMINRIQRDAKIKSSEKLIVCLNRSCDSMLEDACLLTASGKIQDVFLITESSGGDQADEAAVRLSRTETTWWSSTRAGPVPGTAAPTAFAYTTRNWTSPVSCSVRAAASG